MIRVDGCSLVGIEWAMLQVSLEAWEVIPGKSFRGFCIANKVSSTTNCIAIPISYFKLSIPLQASGCCLLKAYMFSWKKKQVAFWLDGMVVLIRALMFTCLKQLQEHTFCSRVCSSSAERTAVTFKEEIPELKRKTDLMGESEDC